MLSPQSRWAFDGAEVIFHEGHVQTRTLLVRLNRRTAEVRYSHSMVAGGMPSWSPTSRNTSFTCVRIRSHI
jgi:hypothetical protein